MKTMKRGYTTIIAVLATLICALTAQAGNIASVSTSTGTAPSVASINQGDMELYYDGRQVGYIKPNGDVYINGRNVGTARSNGEIYVNGRNRGEVRSNGDVYESGRKVGEVRSNGDVYEDGRKVGEIRSNGDVYKNGRQVGRVSNMTNRQWVAVIYFFDLFRF